MDLHALEMQLQAYTGLGRQLIGCFSAASNITGLLADDVATTLLLHQYGALAFWDYAAAGTVLSRATLLIVVITNISLILQLPMSSWT